MWVNQWPGPLGAGAIAVCARQPHVKPTRKSRCAQAKQLLQRTAAAGGGPRAAANELKGPCCARQTIVGKERGGRKGFQTIVAIGIPKERGRGSSGGAAQGRRRQNVHETKIRSALRAVSRAMRRMRIDFQARVRAGQGLGARPRELSGLACTSPDEQSVIAASIMCAGLCP